MSLLYTNCCVRMMFKTPFFFIKIRKEKRRKENKRKITYFNETCHFDYQ